ncbi:HAUS7 [Bugula neritina]|uniref:HAUS7 n=1 Tax=Bugula neritina TaxID=10212 RepID=A0A7J7JAX8_BUGNE|nr:HAUS7 [Bugula neritina]
MAGNSNKFQYGSPAIVKKRESKIQRAIVLQERFQKLECPFTESADETWITDLIFKPGEPRIRILQWLLSKLHYSTYNYLDTIYSHSEVRLKGILQVASSLGLCRPTDLELIEGKGSKSKQKAFINKLLDMVEVADNSQSNYPPSPSKYTIRDSMNVEDQFSRDCSLVDSIVTQQPVAQLFPSNIPVLPIDIVKGLERTAADRELREVLDIQELTEKAKLLGESMSRQCELLKQLQLEHDLGEVDRKARDTQLRRFKLILSELQQMMVNFNYCYENHIQPWCNREAPVLSKLGDKIVSVQRILNNFTTVVGAMKVIRASHGKLDRLASEEGKENISGSVDAPNEVKEKQLAELYKTLTSLEHSLNMSLT